MPSIKTIYLLFASLFLFIQPSSALAPAKNSETAGQISAPPEARAVQHAGHLRRFRLAASPFRRHKNPDDRYNTTAPGTFALVCGIFSLLCFGAFGLTAFSFFIIPAMIFAVLATVFGAIGFRRHRRGFAIIGFVLGLLEIVAGFMLLAMAI